MKDPRIVQLAKGLINYSVLLKKGEKILIEAFDVDHALIAELVKEAYAVGAYPFVEMYDTRVNRELLLGTSEEHAKLRAKFDKARMEEMDAYIGVRGAYNSYENSDVPGDLMSIHAKFYGHPVHHETRVAKTKWVVLRYPTESMAQAAGMSTDAFEDYYFNVCNLDYSKMDKAMDALAELMNKTDKVRIVGKGTDLSFSIKDIPAVKCAGHMNIPDGEVYTAPVRDSVNGVISYNAPSNQSGLKFENVRLEFKNGKIVDIQAHHRAYKSLLDRAAGDLIHYLAVNEVSETSFYLIRINHNNSPLDRLTALHRQPFGVSLPQ